MTPQQIRNRHAFAWELIIFAGWLAGWIAMMIHPVAAYGLIAWWITCIGCRAWVTRCLAH